jgi:hypothetical protein
MQRRVNSVSDLLIRLQKSSRAASWLRSPFTSSLSLSLSLSQTQVFPYHVASVVPKKFGHMERVTGEGTETALQPENMDR